MRQKARAAISDVADEWAARLQCLQLTVVEQADFMAWLRQSPVHVEEYLKSETALFALDGFARQDSTEITSLLENAQGNVRELGLPSMDGGSDVPPAPRRQWHLPWIVATAAAIVIVIAVVLCWSHLVPASSYATEVGEQLHTVLPDGSSVDLNTRSKVEVHYTADSRDIRLTHGEALFSVAKDGRRPFRVINRDAVVRAIGTQFNVLQQQNRTTITVLDGRVAIAARKSTASMGALRQEMLVAAGHRAQVATDEIHQDVQLAPERAIAWKDHRLIFENETIGNVIAEFNRYNRRQIMLDDPALAGQRIDGVFDAEKPQNLIAFLRHNTGARIREVQ